MKIIDLDSIKSPDVFLLGVNEYKYLENEDDKKYYLENILSLDPKIDNTEELKKVFKNILEKQNISVEIINEDIDWLFHYFNSKFL